MSRNGVKEDATMTSKEDARMTTESTGEGQDFAYDADEVEIEDISQPTVRNDDGDVVSGWDYSDWCSRVSLCEDLAVAVAYGLFFCAPFAT